MARSYKQRIKSGGENLVNDSWNLLSSATKAASIYWTKIFLVTGYILLNLLPVIIDALILSLRIMRDVLRLRHTSYLANIRSKINEDDTDKNIAQAMIIIYAVVLALIVASSLFTWSFDVYQRMQNENISFSDVFRALGYTAFGITNHLLSTAYYSLLATTSLVMLPVLSAIGLSMQALSVFIPGKSSSAISSEEIPDAEEVDEAELYSSYFVTTTLGWQYANHVDDPTLRALNSYSTVGRIPFAIDVQVPVAEVDGEHDGARVVPPPGVIVVPPPSPPPSPPPKW